MSNFSEWTLAALERRFELRQVKMLPALADWIAADEPVSDWEKSVLTFLQTSLQENVFGWNEREIALHFIGPVFTLIHFKTDRTNLFAEREFSAVVDGEELRGKPDGFIATGDKEPESPYFCFQEYKKNVDPNGDPYGQCLAAMLAAQAINHNRFPIYGIVVVGKNWDFMVVDHKNYAIFGSLNAVDDEIVKIYKMLLSLKIKINISAAQPA